MGLYLTKSMLYNEVQKIRDYMNIDKNEYGINLIEICRREGILIDSVSFKTKHLRGMAIVDKTNPKDDVILLNSKRGDIEKNFDCGHELIHIRNHRYIKRNFSCLVENKQNSYLEWQANEGAAELVVPYGLLLPRISDNCNLLSSWIGIEKLKNDLAREFRTSPQVIECRFESLKYEIYQYLSGIDLSKINILSHNQLEKENIHVRSINDISVNLLVKETFF